MNRRLPACRVRVKPDKLANAFVMRVHPCPSVVQLRFFRLKLDSHVQITLQQNGSRHFVHLFLALFPADVPLQQSPIGHGGSQAFIP
jgi:hypothetical protein